tara:strand:- start:1485 stop:1778 length:294 start_codon:yes stop_codon:yes gene_type:complete
MSTEYQAQMVVGCYLQDVDYDQTGYREDVDGSFREYLEGEYGIQYYESNDHRDFVGFNIDNDQPLTMSNASKLSKVAHEFKKITRQTAVIKACLLVY